MATYRGLRLPPAMVTQMKNVVVKKSVDLTSFLDRGSVADSVFSEDAGAGWRKNENGSGKSAVGESTSMGSITDNQIIEDHDFGEITVAVSTTNAKSWSQRRRENRVISRARGGNS